MNHPLLTLLASQPQLLLDHAQAYAALTREEFGLAYTSWRRKSLLLAVALACLGVTAVLGGCAFMLWAVHPALESRGQWVLLITPLVPFGAALVCWFMAASQVSVDPFANLKLQVNADVSLWRSARAS